MQSNEIANHVLAIDLIEEYETRYHLHYDFILEHLGFQILKSLAS